MNKILIYVVAIFLIIGMGYTIYSLKSENKRLNNNIEALQLDNARQLALTKGELKEFYGKQLDSLADKLDIKLKNITNVIITKYVYKDTTVTTYKTETVKIQGSENFSISKNCAQIDATIDSIGITIKKIELQDKLTTFLYKDFKKRFLFIKWKPYYTSKIYSECKQDTLQVETNIKVIK